MHRISSRSHAFLEKKIFPILICAFFVGFLYTAFKKGQIEGILVALLGAAVVGGVYFLAVKLSKRAVDEVYDCGDAFLIKNGGQEERVPLTAIANVSVSGRDPEGPTYINLELAQAGKFGERIVFIPATGFAFDLHAAAEEVADDLEARIRIARANARRAP